MNGFPASAANFSSQPNFESEPPPTVFMRFDLPPMPITIRGLQERDVRWLEWHGGPDLRSFYDWQWTQHQLGQRDVIVAIFNSSPIGQVAIQWRDKPSHPLIPDIQSLRVHDAFRGLGIGSRLLEACEREAARRNYAQIGISVSVDNIGARRLYERHGYAAGGQAYEDPWEYTNARGERVAMSEVVLDLIKNLPDMPSLPVNADSQAAS